MKILYVTYENVYKTAILQAMVIKPLNLMEKKYDIKFTITSSNKLFEKDSIYKANKEYIEKYTNLTITEFEKKLTNKQSIFTFIKDLIPMILYIIKESKRNDIIHCRSYGGALIGLIASTITKTPFIFDMRGVLPEETVDVGKITKDSIKFKLLKIVEKVLIKKASYVFTVSDKFNHYIKTEFNKKNSININNPTDFKIFKKNIRNDNKVNFIYSGSMQKWHLPETTIEYFSKIQKKYENQVYLYFCTNDIGKAEKIFDKFNIPKNSYEIKTVPFKEMPSYYSNSDIAFCFIKESFSKSICFPVKFSEYIASNLFVLSNPNIGDIDQIINTYQCGKVFKDLSLIDENISQLHKTIDDMLNNKYINYSRDDMSFLDWNEQGIQNIEKIYRKILNG